MARIFLNIPPAPIRDPITSPVWTRWFQSLQSLLTNAQGLIPWLSVSKEGSQLSEIESRPHNDLQTIQGGTSSQYYHLTQAEYSEIQRQDNVIEKSVSYQILTTDKTIIVTASGTIQTLPAASASLIGKEFEIVFATTGTCVVSTTGGNTFPAPSSATETSLTLTRRGQSVVFRCKSATTWGIV